MVGDNLKLLEELKRNWDEGRTRPPFALASDAREKLEREAGDIRFPHLFSIIAVYKKYQLKYTKFGKARVERFKELWTALRNYKKIDAPELEQMKQYMIEEMKEKARQLGWKTNADIEIPIWKPKKKAKTITVTVRKGKYSAKADLLDSIETAYPSKKQQFQTLTKVNLLFDPKIGFGAKALARAVAANWGKNIMFNFDWLTTETLGYAIAKTLPHEIVHCLHQQRKMGKDGKAPYEEEMSENLAFYISGEPDRAWIFAKIPGFTMEKATALLRAWIKYKAAGHTTPVAREAASAEVLGKTWAELRGKKKTIPIPAIEEPAPPPITPPPPPPPPPAPGVPGLRRYTVVAGDTLWKIAAKLLGAGSRWPEIYELNKWQIVNPNLIYIGQILLIPALTPPPAPAPPPPPPPPPAPPLPPLPPPPPPPPPPYVPTPIPGCTWWPAGTRLRHKDGYSFSTSDGRTCYDNIAWKPV